jgi:hypothetical protein
MNLVTDEKDSTIYKKSASSTRQEKSFLIKRRSVSSQRSSSRVQNYDYPVIVGKEDSLSFASSISSEDEGNTKLDTSEIIFQNDISTKAKTDNFYSQPQSEGRSNVQSRGKKTFKRKSKLPPPNPLLKKRHVEAEPTYSVYPHRLANEKTTEEYEFLQKWNEEIEAVGAKLENKNYESRDSRLERPEMEWSIRKFYFMEYSKKFEPNPIVYSRFGKQNYNSDEKFYENKPSVIKLKEKQRIHHSVTPYYQKIIAKAKSKDKTLVFESRFESGNLDLAIKASLLENQTGPEIPPFMPPKINNNFDEYNLILQNDTNTRGHTQWYYFKVSNTFKGRKVKFNVLNLSKPTSLYSKGMKILIYSQKKVENENVGWYRGGTSIKYFRNHYRRELPKVGARHHYTLTFIHKFEFDDDEVYFAHSLPYTYTDLKNHLDNLEKKSGVSSFLTRNTLCRTLAGNKWEYLTITTKGTPEEIQKK